MFLIWKMALSVSHCVYVQLLRIHLVLKKFVKMRRVHVNKNTRPSLSYLTKIAVNTLNLMWALL